MIWLIGLAAFALFFAAAETWCIKTGRKTLSRTIWTLNKDTTWFGPLFGLVVGTLLCHLFWGGIVCFAPVQ
jgi:hypothetical protein